MAALWKQEVPLHPTFVPINASLREDWFLLPHEIELQRASAIALEACGILSPEERRNVDQALAEIQSRFGQEPCPDSHAEDLHTWMEGMLVERIADTGKKLHTARSRNDQVATLLVLYLIAEGRRLGERLSSFIRVCCLRALEWRSDVVPLQTHAQFAVPGTTGFWILRYAVAMARIQEHVTYFRNQWQQFCPLGSGAAAGSSIPLDRHILARGLDFEQPSLNALVTTSTRDECVEYLNVAAQIALQLQSFAADVIAFSQTPFGWTNYPRAFGTGSSMMPQKANPDAMELLRGQACAVIAGQQEALLLLKGLPSGYNRDLQCIKPVVHRTAEKLSSLIELAGAFLQELEFNRDMIEKSLTQGDLDATSRMERKVIQGIPLRDAHHQVAKELAASHSAGKRDDLDCRFYRTSGSAHPDETQRVAQLILSSLDSQQSGLH